MWKRAEGISTKGKGPETVSLLLAALLSRKDSVQRVGILEKSGERNPTSRNFTSDFRTQGPILLYTLFLFDKARSP